jgi:hypothetical protein
MYAPSGFLFPSPLLSHFNTSNTVHCSLVLLGPDSRLPCCSSAFKCKPPLCNSHAARVPWCCACHRALNLFLIDDTMQMPD